MNKKHCEITTSLPDITPLQQPSKNGLFAGKKAETPESRNFTPSDIDSFIRKMRSENLPDSVIESFCGYYRQLRNGNKGFIPESMLAAVLPEEIPHLSNLSHFEQYGERMLPHTVVLKLNGGLGTTMGCSGPKSLIKVKNDLNFLDIVIHRIISQSSSFNTTIPLILMNSFNTEEQSLRVLADYPQLRTGLPQTFLQHKFPKVLASSFQPYEDPENRHLEWNPPGHGDLYCAICTSGLLDALIAKEFRYAFISNIDNLGAELDLNILGYMTANSIDFLMEVAERTPMDRKGGHIGRLGNGQLILREARQCPEENMDKFLDIGRHRFFNTNNLWIDLVALRDILNKRKGNLDLPMICNRKRIDPLDKRSPEVYQLEAAMGSALSIFKNSTAVQVERTRFIPVKASDDLLLLWSDFFNLSEDYRIVPAIDGVTHIPVIDLDGNFYLTEEQLRSHFPFGAPSLRNCTRLSIKGDVTFGRNVEIRGDVRIHNFTGLQHHIPDNSCIDHDLIINTETLQ